ncbi:DUF3147 domain-containing protein, partial [Dysosmobacter welbionis]
HPESGTPGQGVCGGNAVRLHPLLRPHHVHHLCGTIRRSDPHRREPCDSGGAADRYFRHSPRSGHRRYHDPLGHSLRAGRRSSPRLRTAGSVRHHHRHPQHHRAPDRGGTDRPASCADTDEHVCGQP